ncbi:MAG: ribonuclease HII [Bdellovibrionota bacterium]
MLKPLQQRKKLKIKKLAGNFTKKFDLTGIAPFPLIGVDEVGRGCLAGPVYAAAVVFLNDEILDQLADSKVLSEQRREELSEKIHLNHHVSLGFADVNEIDNINILKASLLAMRRAVEGLGIISGHILVDGNQKIPDLPHWPQTTVIKGDSLVPQISAASVVAKVYRDRLMKTFSEKYPGYGFEIHKGYGTEKHRRAIAGIGPCILHRRTFSGVKEFL